MLLTRATIRASYTGICEFFSQLSAMPVSYAFESGRPPGDYHSYPHHVCQQEKRKSRTISSQITPKTIHLSNGIHSAAHDGLITSETTATSDARNRTIHHDQLTFTATKPRHMTSTDNSVLPMQSPKHQDIPETNHGSRSRDEIKSPSPATHDGQRRQSKRIILNGTQPHFNSLGPGKPQATLVSDDLSRHSHPT